MPSQLWLDMQANYEDLAKIKGQIHTEMVRLGVCAVFSCRVHEPGRNQDVSLMLMHSGIATSCQHLKVNIEEWQNDVRKFVAYVDNEIRSKDGK